MASSTPWDFRYASVWTMIGLLSTGREGLARLSVSGRIRSPRPAARIIAFMMLCPHKSAGRHRRKGASRVLCGKNDHGRECNEEGLLLLRKHADHGSQKIISCAAPGVSIRLNM